MPKTIFYLLKGDCVFHGYSSNHVKKPSLVQLMLHSSMRLTMSPSPQANIAQFLDFLACVALGHLSADTEAT